MPGGTRALENVKAYPTEGRLKAKERRIAGIQPKKKIKPHDRHFDDYGSDFRGLGSKDEDMQHPKRYYVDDETNRYIDGTQGSVIESEEKEEVNLGIHWFIGSTKKMTRYLGILSITVIRTIFCGTIISAG